MFERIIGVMKLDVPTYEAIEHDESALTEAAIIVFVVALLSAVGGYLAAGAANQLLDSVGSETGILELAQTDLSATGLAISSFLGVFISWGVWSVLTYFIGTRLGGQATIGEMARVLGYAQAPRLLSWIPCLGIIFTIWSLVAGFIAVRQGLDLSNGKAAITILIAFFVALLINVLLIAPVLAAAGLS